MKNFLILSTAISSIAFSSALAKNGHQISIEASKIEADQEFGSTNFLGSDDAILPTIGYGYKVEFNKFFIKPAIYYNIGDIEIKDTTNGSNYKSTFNPLFSIEGDFGYDITSKFGVFGTVGLMSASLEREQSGASSEATETGLIYGLGIRYDVLDQLSLTAKYQTGQIDYEVQNSSEDLTVDTSAIRLGLSYNF